MAVRAAQPEDRILELGQASASSPPCLPMPPGVHVWAFEANPATVHLARRVIAANDRTNVTLCKGILTGGEPREMRFYVRRELWMSSLMEHQGTYDKTMTMTSLPIDEFVSRRKIDLVVMDIEGAEHELLTEAELPGVERVFMELHDHLYELAGIRDITKALAK